MVKGETKRNVKFTRYRNIIFWLDGIHKLRGEIPTPFPILINVS